MSSAPFAAQRERENNFSEARESMVELGSYTNYTCFSTCCSIEKDSERRGHEKDARTSSPVPVITKTSGQ